MAKRGSVPPMRPRDVVFTSPAEPEAAPANVRANVYLRPEQHQHLDELRLAHRSAGRRSVTASDLVRAALELAERHPDEWDAIIRATAR